MPAVSDDFPIVAIGASAGGLEACGNFLSTLPACSGMAYLIVQHLDPAHESLLAELLASHTKMPVGLAADGMAIEANHVYVIAPGTFLSIARGMLHVTRPPSHRGVRFPFDVLLQSMAREFHARAACVVLSGTGTDGSAGVLAIKNEMGLVIAQEPTEAGYDGMPKAAIQTGRVDLILPIAKMHDALAAYIRPPAGMAPMADASVPDMLPEIVEFLRSRTPHDFRLYKPGTLTRSIERRMAVCGIGMASMRDYLDFLKGNAKEVDDLAADLLINVTAFFRDKHIFEFLAAKVVPGVVRNRQIGKPIRIWIVGCSTGQEAYSLAMLFQEYLDTSDMRAELQIFASDVDPDAVAAARDGLYPFAITGEVSQSRLTRFFTKEEAGYRVSPELRATVVFTVQDVLTDPPFSNMDMVSCRNVLIYLQPEAQAKIIGLFHFALRGGGILLLGSSETIGGPDLRFDVVSATERVYRQTGRPATGRLGFIANMGKPSHAAPAGGTERHVEQRPSVAELCQRLVLEAHAPAAVLINRKYEVLYSLGPTNRYLRVPPGAPTQDLLAMVMESTRIGLRAAVHQAIADNTRVTGVGGRGNFEGVAFFFNLDVWPVPNDGDDLLLVCFIDEPKAAGQADPPPASHASLSVTELEQELGTTKAELRDAVRNLEILAEEQKVVNEEALSVNEEYQSTNEELLTSKEELQSLNEELTALNGQLQETLERQRLTSNDLQNVLYSTNVATIFLDNALNIRLFTPATKSLFNIITTDIGRPLADLKPLAVDDTLLDEAKAVIGNGVPLEREIEADTGSWYLRRILPYRIAEQKADGVVVMFSDITERKHISVALNVAKRAAELANVAKSRFLAAASHDIRQPLQTLSLLQAALAKTVESGPAQNLISRLDEALGAMTEILNSLLDINQIEAGTVQAARIAFPVNLILDHILSGCSDHAAAKGLDLRIVPTSAWTDSDPRLLEQIIRNLVNNAIKYTTTGKILIGCRRHGAMLDIEIFDTGIGIPKAELTAIFEEYHQIDNPARDRTRGLGLGLSIVQSLGQLLGHPVAVRSIVGRGSVFSVTVPLVAAPALTADSVTLLDDQSMVAPLSNTGAILLIEDEPEMRGLLTQLLTGEGHRVMGVPDGVAARDLVARREFRPDLVLSDYNLPNGMNGLEAAAALRGLLGHRLPVIILTGDISTGTLRDIAFQGCVHLHKPVKPQELMQAVRTELPARPVPFLPSAAPAVTPAPHADAKPGQRVIYLVDDDDQVRGALRTVLESIGGWAVEDFATSEAFLAVYRPGREACLLIDAYLPGMTGLDLLRQLQKMGQSLPAIMITGFADVGIAVAAMKAGASDFIEKPVSADDLIASVERALEQARDSGKATAWREDAAKHVATLTDRQREVMEMVLAGHPSKNIAADLNISQRTVENHRAAIMKRTGARSLPALARLALAATGQQTAK